MSSSNTPCAACKIQRRKCTQECIFAPYFSPDEPQKFAYVHKVFGASNVSKLLNEISVSQREDAVNSLTYEAEARLRDPVFGCVGQITFLHEKLRNVQSELNDAKKELASLMDSQVMLPPLPPSTLSFHQPPRNSSVFPVAVPSQSQEVFSYNNLEGLSGSTSFHDQSFNQIQVNHDHSFNQIQVNHFHNHNLMISPSQQQPLHSFNSQKLLKFESDDNYGTLN